MGEMNLPQRAPGRTARCAAVAGDTVERNPGMPLDLDWVRSVRVDHSAVDRHVAALRMRRVLTGEARAAWLLRALSCIDLTTLSGDDTAGRVQRLCAKARQPLRPDLRTALAVPGAGERVAAVCVYHRFVRSAVAALAGSGIPVAAVSTGFPTGLIPFDLKLREIDASVADGAQEIDIVITREHVLTGDWAALYDEIRACRQACGDAHMKVILATGDIRGLREVARASFVAMMAGADFVKTSTGKESVNATLPVALVMLRTVRDYFERTGYRVGFKPAGGVSTAPVALDFLVLVKETLGRRWLEADLFRFGASSLLASIELALETYLTGRPSAPVRHALG